MTGRPKFLSRRVVLRLMTATPISVSAANAYAQAPPGCDKLAGKHGRKFAKVSQRLWLAFRRGVEVGSPAGTTVKINDDVFLKAVELSGPFVLRSLDQFREETGDHVEGEKDVFRCCIACGIAAASRASVLNPPVIDQEVFLAAWCDTKACYSNVACKNEKIDPLPNHETEGSLPNPLPAPATPAPRCDPPTDAEIDGPGIRSVGCG